MSWTYDLVGNVLSETDRLVVGVLTPTTVIASRAVSALAVIAFLLAYAPRLALILGGGFGGLYAARALQKAPVEITLVDRSNHHLFQPLLYQVATAALSPAEQQELLRTMEANVARMQREQAPNGDAADPKPGRRRRH